MKGRIPQRAPGYRPVWAPVKVDVTVGQVHPLPGWVMVDEQFLETAPRVNSGLLIIRPGTSNTVYGRVVCLHEDTERELGVEAGDLVVYREWSGSRWMIGGKVVLLTPSRDILATVKESVDA